MEDNEFKILKIVLTGGPCAGKTSLLPLVKERISGLGYYVLCVPESATELMTNGISPSIFVNSIEYMESQTRLQLLKEEIYENAARSLCKSGKTVLIICDRGIMDVKAYMNENDFNGMLEKLGLSADMILGNYYAVFHLTTMALVAPQYYTICNNSARKESPKQAILLDEMTFDAWKGHQNLIKVDFCNDINSKASYLAECIDKIINNANRI